MKANKIIFCTVFFFVLELIAFPLYFSIAGEKVYIDINSPYLRKIPVVIGSDIAGKETSSIKISEEVSSVLKDDMDYSGYFEVKNIFYRDSSVRQKDGAQLPSGEGASLYINNRVFYSDNELAVEFRLYDVVEKKFIIGRRYKGRTEDVRRISHRFVDEILEKVTGIRGPFESKIAYISQLDGKKRLIISDYDGRSPKIIREGSSIITSPVWSRDSSKLAYTSYRSGKPSLYIIDFSNGAEKEIPLPGNLPLAGAWSPVGNKIAVTLSIEGNPDIYAVNLDNGKIENLISSRYLDLSPSWSPDGKNIVFTSNRHGSPQIFISDINGREMKRISHSGSYNTSPSWSPAGDKIVFTSRLNGKFNIATVNSTGTGLKYLTGESGNNESPSWSPDGRFITFASDRNGVYNIYIMKSDGSGQRKIGISRGKETEPEWAFINNKPYWGRK